MKKYVKSQLLARICNEIHGQQINIYIYIYIYIYT